MDTPYRPSNSTQGEEFQRRWCDHCAADKEFRETFELDGTDPGCPILQVAHWGPVPQWIEDEKGPFCTSFESDGSPVRCRQTLDIFSAGGPA